ncbi:unnamed protein product [Mytilus coruscus]|uniref:Death domain-containing protein n=1 Tax=Mytilus coruscus TaxID=42192 RepID=A0A6J7ZTW9_MYTCO|nr:unnamed protein product [Mytilus coruscus]
MSKEEPLKQIFHLLQDNIHAYMQSSDHYIKMREGPIRRSRSIKASSCPTNPKSTKYYGVKDQGTSVTPPESPTECQCLCHQQFSGRHCNFSTSKVMPEINVLDLNKTLYEQTISKRPDITLPESANATVEGKDDEEVCLPTLKCPLTQDTENLERFVLHNVMEQQLSVMRENTDLKIQMQEVQKHIKIVQKDQEDHENTNHHLTLINDILSKVLCTQKRSEILCDKLSELREFCDSIRKTVGQDFRQIGRELGIEPDILNNIEDEYSDADECLHQIILEWSTRTETPSYHALVTACCNVNPDILKCKPLEEEKARVLERSYSMLCDEMLEVPLLPHLISDGVMSLKMQRYILQPKTHDQRICRLLNILRTRQNGFEALLSALDLSDQRHVSDQLKNVSF